MAKQHPDWAMLLPTWIADEVLHVGAADAITALKAHVQIADDHPDVGVVVRDLIEREAAAWQSWSRDAELVVYMGKPCPPRPTDGRVKLSIGRVPPDVREQIKTRADALNIRHTVYAAGVVALAARRASWSRLDATLG